MSTATVITNATTEDVLGAAQQQKLESSIAGPVAGVVSRHETPGLSQSDSDEEDSQDPLEQAVVELKRDHEIKPLDIVYSEEVGAVEPTTRIMYPAKLNNYIFIGCGVRTKYMFFHAYTVGLYLDSDVDLKKAANNDDLIHDLLMDPNYPKVFRIVMNRNVTSKQYKGAIYDALTPLMRGQDMDKLDEMNTQEMPTMLNKGIEIFLTVQGKILTMQLGSDQAGEIESMVLTRALCENYVGDRPVSPAMKKAVWEGMRKKVNGNSSE